MSFTLTQPPPSDAFDDAAVPRRGTRILALAQARWAAAALALFLVGLALKLTGAPPWLCGALFALTYISGGWEPGWTGLRALRHRRLDVDLLMVIAAIGAAGMGQLLDGALLIVIFATSGTLEALATARTADSVTGLLDLAPTTATRIGDDGSEERVPTERLRAGQVILVRPGERIGADGRVMEGASEVDQTTITGEPMPATKATGDEVFAGTVNGTGALRVKVEREPSDSMIARIVAMVEEAARTKAPTQLLIERVERWYSLGMVAATLALLVLPLAFGAPARPSLSRAMTFMIVASPCAVVLATMPPLLSAIASAGRRGVLVKSSAVMERLGRVDAVALDKTGTLTEGSPRVTDVRPLATSALTEDELLGLAAAVEHLSEHPLARAIVDAARGRNLGMVPAKDFTSAPGTGVTALVGGRTVAVRSPAPGPGGHLDRSAAKVVARLEDAGRTAVVVEIDHIPVGVLGIADRLRADAGATVTALTTLIGTAPVLVTGDNPGSAARIADQVGITDVRAGLLPQDKVTAVRELERAGRRVLVVGDGVNDAPALAAAHTSIAMGRAGSDLALETADAVIGRDELAAIPKLITMSRRARRLVMQNLVIAALFIGGLVIWDLAGTLPLPLGVAGHEGSTVIVGLNGLRLLTDPNSRRANDTGKGR